MDAGSGRSMVKTISIVCLSTIITIGFVCNIFAIFFLYTNRKRAIIKDIIIVVLCLINLLQLSAFCLELYLVLHDGIGDTACIASAFLVCFCTYTAIGCFLMLMLERYTAILYPFKYVIWTMRTKTKISCFLIPPVYGLFLSGAPLLGWGGYGHSTPNSTYCAFDFKGRSMSDRSFFFFVVALSFGLPLVISAVCFGRIIVELRRTAWTVKRQYGRASSISRDSHKSTNEQCISSLLTSLVYIASWLPYSIVLFFFFYKKHVSIAFEYTAIYLAKSSVVTSPIVFCLIEKRVRSFIKTKTQLSYMNDVINIKEQSNNNVIVETL